MNSFKNFLLIENSVRNLKKSIKDIDTSHDPYAEHTEPHKIIDHFANNAALPEKRNSHTNWIVSRYRKGDFDQDDTPRVRTALKNFETHRDKLDQKDLTSYKSLSDVESAVKPHVERGTRRQQKDEGADLIHSENGTRVWHVKTHDAACKYGAGTRWCISGREGASHFDSYSRKSNIYMMHDKKTDTKRAILPTTGEIRDEKDYQVKPEKLVKNHPELKNVDELKVGPHRMHFAKNEKEVDKFFHEDWKTNPDEVLSSPNTKKKHIDHVFDYIKSTENEDGSQPEFPRYGKALSKNPNLTPEHRTKLRSKMGGDHEVETNLLQNPSISQKELDNHVYQKPASLSTNPRVPHVMSNPGLTDDHVSHLIKNHPNDRDISYNLIKPQGERLTDKHIHQALDRNHMGVTQDLIEHPKIELTGDHVDRIMSHGDKSVNQSLAQSGKIKDFHKLMTAAENSPSGSHVTLHRAKLRDDHANRLIALGEHDPALAQNENLKPEHYNKLIDKHFKSDDTKSETIASAIGINQKLPKESVDHAAKSLNMKNDYHSMVARQLAGHDNLSSKGLGHLLDHAESMKDSNKKHDMIATVSTRPDLLKPEHVDRLFSHAEKSDQGITALHASIAQATGGIRQRHVDKILEHGNVHMRDNLVRHVDIDELKDSHLDTLHAAGRHLEDIDRNPSLKQRHWDRLMKYELPMVNKKLAPTATPDQVDKFVKNNYSVGSHIIAGSPHLKKSHIDKLTEANHPESGETHDVLAMRSDLTDDHINKLIDNSRVMTTVRALAHNKNLKDHHIDKILDMNPREHGEDLAHRDDLQPRHVERIKKEGSRWAKEFLSGR